ncbi:MAG TPA: trypsin-like serine protease [Bryobacteraceae bacterium]|nr:trypsin-like serine protease [Bryobacteraceae bacterium]
MIGTGVPEQTVDAAAQLDDCAAVGRLDVAGWYAGGVLVHPRFVVTVAHTGPRGGKPMPDAVALRAADLSDAAGAEVIAGKFIDHEDYTGNGARDIAAMVLERSSTVRPIPLATAGEMAEAREVMLAGFGADREAGWLGLRVRRAVTVPIRFLAAGPLARETAFPPSIRFDPDLEFLAGAEDRGACFGDSGGPAYITAGGRRKLAGIISRPARQQKPYCKGLTIITRIDAFQDWIERRIP